MESFITALFWPDLKFVVPSQESLNIAPIWPSNQFMPIGLLIPKTLVCTIEVYR